MDFTGQRVVITGGSSGIGLATAKAVADLGGEVCIVGRDQGRLKQATALLGGNVEAFCADVTDEAALSGLFSRIGAFNHLVTAAGPMPTDGPFLSVRTQDARALFEGKFWGQFFTVKHAAPKIVPGGSVTMFGGSVSRKAAPGSPVFAAIDGAIESLGRIIAIELAPVRVNVIAPGIIDTPMLNGMSPEMRTAVLNRSAQGTMVKRYGKAEDVAKAVLFLMDNTFVSGTVLDTDGGKLGSFWHKPES